MSEFTRLLPAALRASTISASATRLERVIDTTRRGGLSVDRVRSEAEGLRQDLDRLFEELEAAA